MLFVHFLLVFVLVRSLSFFVSLFFVILSGVVSETQAQQRRLYSARDYIMRKQWLKAKADITLALQNDKTKDSCETWYLAGIIDFGISRDSVLRRDYPDAMRSSFEAFRKAQSISSDQYNRLVIANSGATNPVRAIGALYFESAVNEFNRKNFLEALRNFQRSLAVNRYLVELRDPNVPEGAVSSY